MQRPQIADRGALVFLIAAFIFGGCATKTVSPDTPPNIIFIIADDLGAQALGAYGNKTCLTPNIDRLASEGTLMTRAYSQYPVCGPSRAALLSGLYPERLGIMNNGQSQLLESVLDTLPTLPEYFRSNSYRTIRLGKIYHMRVPGDITAGVDGPDHKESWNESFNFQGKEWMSPGMHEHLSNRHLQFDPNRHYNLGFGTAFYTVKTDTPDYQPDYNAATKAIEIISQHANEQKKPLFLAVGFIRPHVPLVAPKGDFEKYDPDDISLPPIIPNDLDDIPPVAISITDDSFGMDRLITRQKVLQAYYASVTFIDRQVGRIIDALAQSKLSDNTIVVFTSDHGYHLGEHTMWQKMSLHEESVRIPLILKGPGIPVASRNQLFEQIDLYPTLCELAGLPIPRHLQGFATNFSAENNASNPRTSAYSVTNKGRMIRTDQWAYIVYNDGSKELYDMSRDPFQYHNLIDDPDFDMVINEMQHLLLKRSSEAK